MEVDITNHSQVLGGAWLELGGSSGGTGGVKDTTRPTESNNLGPWGLTENEPPTKEHEGAGTRPYTFVANVSSCVSPSH